MNESFRFILHEELDRGESIDETQISVRALDLDFAVFQDDKMRE
jgi:hypothetical protein